MTFRGAVCVHGCVLEGVREVERERERERQVVNVSKQDTA